MYEDDVLLNLPYTQSKGVECYVKINIGSIYGLNVGTLLWNMMVDKTAKSKNGTGKFQIELFANDETTSWYAFKLLIDRTCPNRTIRSHGLLSKLKVKVSIPSDELTNIDNYELNKIELGIIRRSQISGAY